MKMTIDPSPLFLLQQSYKRKEFFRIEGKETKQKNLQIHCEIGGFKITHTQKNTFPFYFFFNLYRRQASQQQLSLTTAALKNNFNMQSSIIKSSVESQPMSSTQGTKSNSPPSTPVLWLEMPETPPNSLYLQTSFLACSLMAFLTGVLSFFI